MLAKAPRLGAAMVPPAPGESGEAAAPVPPLPPKVAHYMLFGKPNTARARQELRAAVDYVAKAGITVGFSLDEAAGAQIITIVGGPEVVSEEAEQSLRGLGHEVQRIGGDRLSILDALEDLGSKRVLRGGRPAAGETAVVEHPAGKAGVILGAGALPGLAAAVPAEKKTRGRRAAKKG